MRLSSLFGVALVGLLLIGCNESLLEQAGVALKDAQTVADVRAALKELEEEGGADRAIANAYCALVTEESSAGQIFSGDSSLTSQLADLAERHAFGISTSVIEGKANQFATAVQLSEQVNGGVASYYLKACGTLKFRGG